MSVSGVVVAGFCCFATKRIMRVGEGVAMGGRGRAGAASSAARH